MSLLVVKRPYHAYSQLLFQVVQNSSSSQINLLNRYSVKQFCKITVHQDEVQDYSINLRGNFLKVSANL